MKHRYLACGLALLASACTISSQGGGNVNLPLTYHDWQTEHYTNKSGAQICTLSSGYNGLSIILRHQPNGDDVFVRGDRILKPGVTLTVTTSNNRYETYEAYFSASTSRNIVEDFAQGGKAYLEWSEIGGATGEQHLHQQNIVRLDDFQAKLKKCQNLLKNAGNVD